MLTTLKKYLSIVFLALLSCTIISQSHGACAITDSKKLLRGLYRARLEYPSDSCASKKMETVIEFLEDRRDVVWDKKTNWALNMNIEMIFDDCPEMLGGKLCSPTSPRRIVAKWSPYIVANFGESLLGNIWQLKKIDNDIFLEKIHSPARK